MTPVRRQGRCINRYHSAPYTLEFSPHSCFLLVWIRSFCLPASRAPLYRGYNNNKKPLRIFESEIFHRFLLFQKISAKFFQILLFYFFLAKFGLSGGRFFNVFLVFAFKIPQKIFACGGLMDPGFYYFKKILHRSYTNIRFVFMRKLNNGICCRDL